MRWKPSQKVWPTTTPLSTDWQMTCPWSTGLRWRAFLKQAAEDSFEGRSRDAALRAVNLTRTSHWPISARRRFSGHQLGSAEICECSQANPSGSTKDPALPPMMIRCQPLPSGETPSSLAQCEASVERQLDLVGVSIELDVLASIALRHREAVIHVELPVAATSVAPMRSTISSIFRVAGPVFFFDDVAIFQIVPSGACRTPP